MGIIFDIQIAEMIGKQRGGVGHLLSIYSSARKSTKKERPPAPRLRSASAILISGKWWGPIFSTLPML